jgi:hypothetical protein
LTRGGLIEESETPESHYSISPLLLDDLGFN